MAIDSWEERASRIERRLQELAGIIRFGTLVAMTAPSVLSSGLRSRIGREMPAINFLLN